MYKENSLTASAAPVRRAGRPSGCQGAELLAVAREVFLEFGFGGATMQEVATRARISKSSLYRAHESKDDLFAAVVKDWAERGRDAMRPHVARLLAADDLHGAFVELATTLQGAVLAPEVVGMRRLVAAESDRFPETAASYLADSWTSNINALADAIRDLAARNDVHVADAWLAAHQFTWTAVGAALNARTIAGSSAITPAIDLNRFATAAANTLIADPDAGSEAAVSS
jgi:TetR/AcrR family transcriptional regulator, mexJK operon transcriptional repressor